MDGSLNVFANLNNFGNVKITTNGKTNTYKNRVVTDGILWIAELILDLSVTDPINYIAVGSSNVPTALNMTSLVTEVERKEVTAINLFGLVPTWETFFSQDKFNFHWFEMGLFADATSAPGSGRMITRVTVDEEKTNAVTKNVVWELIMANA